MKKDRNLLGKQYGRWQVIGESIVKKGTRLWLCRCACEAQTEKYVYEQNLLSGKSQSCGCLSRENAKKRIRDLTDKKFGSLTVESRAENLHGRAAWNCLCDCGARKVVTGHDLSSGHTITCGGHIHRLERGMLDLSGRQFGRLTVLYPTKNRDYKGSVLWQCKCACGNTVSLSEDALVHGKQKSCGCLKCSQAEKLTSYLHFYGGTCLEYLKRPLRSDNSTGVAGVYRSGRGNYRAMIGFQGRKYHLGSFDSAAEAISARKNAEEELFVPFIRAYEAWLHHSMETDFYFSVDQAADGSFLVESNYIG